MTVRGTFAVDFQVFISFTMLTSLRLVVDLVHHSKRTETKKIIGTS